MSDANPYLVDEEEASRNPYLGANPYLDARDETHDTYEAQLRDLDLTPEQAAEAKHYFDEQAGPYQKAGVLRTLWENVLTRPITNFRQGFSQADQLRTIAGAGHAVTEEDWPTFLETRLDTTNRRLFPGGRTPETEWLTAQNAPPELITGIRRDFEDHYAGRELGGLPREKRSQALLALAGGVEGAQNLVADTIGFFTSPAGLATGGIGPALPRLGRIALGLGFLADMGRHAPAQFEAFKGALERGDTPEAIRLGVEGTGQAVMLGGIGRHTLSEIRRTTPADRAVFFAEPQDRTSTLAPDEIARRATLPAGPLPEAEIPAQPPAPANRSGRRVSVEDEAAIEAEAIAQEQSRPTPAREALTTAGEAEPPAATPAAEPAQQTAGAAIFPSPEGRQFDIAAPLPFTRSVLTGIHRGAAGLADIIKTIAGHSMPRITRADRATGELGVRYASSRIAALFAARSFVNEILRGLDVDAVKFGAALTEDNLRSVKSGFLANGDTAAAAQVKTLIGARNSPFRTEQAYQDFLNRPGTQAALARHREAWDAIIDPQYRAAMRLDDSLTLPGRGQQTQARINLFAVREGDQLQRPRSVIAAQSPNLTATFRRKSPFGRRATGASEQYAVDYQDIMANTFGRQLEIANKNKFDAALVRSGDAAIGPPGERPLLKGEETVSFPLQRTVLVERAEGGQTKSVPLSANIYVRKSLAREYELAANLYRNRLSDAARVLTGGLNQAALAGLTDATVHLSNLGTVLFTRPMTGLRNPIGDILAAGLGRADIPINIIRAIGKAMRDNSKQLGELAEIGVLRADRPAASSLNPFKQMGRLIHWADQTTRLLMDDTFKAMAARGLVENTETARREFVNQAGQYNKRLQGVLTHALRESGLGPFITAGKAFNTLAIRNLLLDPGVKATSPAAAFTLRAAVAARWVGAFALIGTLNYLLTKDKGGGVTGRPGTPLGRIDTGRDNEAGRPLTVPALDLFGLGRPLRVSGVRGFVEAKRLGLDTQAGIDAAARDVGNSWSGPILGPPVRFAVGAATGYTPAMGVGRAHPVVPPGDSQAASDLANALYEANPLLATARESGTLAEYLPWMPFADQLPPKPTSEVIARQIPRFTLLPGKPAEVIERYPEIVQRAKANTYLDDVIHRARAMGAEQRTRYLTESLARLPPEEQGHAWQEVQRRKVFVLPAAAQGKE